MVRHQYKKEELKAAFDLTYQDFDFDFENKRNEEIFEIIEKSRKFTFL